MAPTPEFIPLSKGKEMLAVSSWRDSPGLHATTSVHPTLSPSRPAMDGGSSAERTNANNSDEEASKERARQARSKTSRSRNGRHKSASSPSSTQDGQDIDDYFVHVYLPPSISLATLQYELRAQVTPLRMFDIGLPRALLTGRSNETSKAAAAVASSTTPTTTHTTGITHASGKGLTPNDSPSENEPKIVLLPFTTPAIHATTPATAALNNNNNNESEEDVPGALPPDMALPPPELSATLGPATHNTAAPPPPQEVVTTNHSVKDTTTNNSNSSSSDGTEGYQVSLLFAELSEAEKAAAFIRRRWPVSVTAVVVPRSRAVLNASLVLKALPSLAKSEVVLTALEQLPCRPSYVRLHRGERGVFKNVIFVKYSNREAAEESKLRLERLALAGRSLKVEFKKKVARLPGPEDGGDATSATVNLPQLVRKLRVSAEHEGFVFQRGDLTIEELKLLKQLCQSYTLGFDLTEHKVTVRRYFGSGGLHHGTSGRGNAVATSSSHSNGTYVSHTGGGVYGTTSSERPSPALRPQSTPSANTTPAWAPATPAPLRPMDFKGIRHWKEIHSQVNTLGILRPLGPDDGLRAFAAGRGRPL